MRGVVYAGDGRIAVDDVAAPRIEDERDAIVDVAATSICGTDLHLIHGDGLLARGVRLGHEYTGVVSEIGSAVRRIQPGDSVIGSSFVACGTCRACLRGEHWHCRQRMMLGTGSVFGPPLDGAQAEQVRVPFADVSLTPVRDGIDSAAAVLLSDVLPTGYHAAAHGTVRPGDVVAIVGAGPVGLSALLVAELCGAAAIVSVDRVSSRRAAAAELGAVADEDGKGIVQELSGGWGADVVIEASGSAGGLALSHDLVRGGGTVAIVGAPGHGATFDPVTLFEREARIRFVIGNPISAREELTRLVRFGVLPTAPLLSHRLTLDEAPEAYELFAQRSALKVLLTV
jgi:alcohol dehydrogenase